MRKWGVIISVFYALLVVGLLLPGFFALSGEGASTFSNYFSKVSYALKEWDVCLVVSSLVAGQILLLFLSVDTSHKRLKPRTHIAVSCAVTSMLFAFLMFAAIVSIAVAAKWNNFGDRYLGTTAHTLGFVGILWALWGAVFYLYFRNATNVIPRAVSWLLRGSVLELLIAVPCHVIVRRRDECSAPLATSFGIVTGIAVMLLSFGPGILLLYKKRLDAYATRSGK
jgi:hypothetical protein